MSQAYDTSKLVDAVTEIVAVNLAGDRKFQINTGMTPDIIKVQVLSTNAGAISEVYDVISNIFGGRDTIAICTGDNSTAPISIYSNPNRKAFQGHFDADVFVVGGAAVETNYLVLKFDFLRYE